MAIDKLKVMPSFMREVNDGNIPKSADYGISNDALASVESQITVKFAELSDAVKADNAEKVAEIVNEAIILIGYRNKKCKLLK